MPFCNRNKYFFARKQICQIQYKSTFTYGFIEVPVWHERWISVDLKELLSISEMFSHSFTESDCIKFLRDFTVQCSDLATLIHLCMLDILCMSACYQSWIAIVSFVMLSAFINQYCDVPFLIFWHYIFIL